MEGISYCVGAGPVWVRGYNDVLPVTMMLARISKTIRVAVFLKTIEPPVCNPKAALPGAGINFRIYIGYYLVVRRDLAVYEG
jgi:hypothetical protein